MSPQLRRRALVAPMTRPPSPLREKAREMLRTQTAGEVAAELKVPVATVRGWARALGRDRGRPEGFGKPRGPDKVPRAERQMPRKEALPVIDLLLQGESITEIADALGLSRQAVHEVRDRWLSDEPS